MQIYYPKIKIDILVEKNSKPNTEATYKKLNQLIFIIYWLLIFEGALRKWIFPQFQQQLFFIRDPFVLILYFLAWKNKIWTKTSSFLIYIYILSFVSIMVNLIASLFGEFNPISIIYGWRNYFLYIPMAFIIRETFNRRDFNILIKYTLVTVIFISPLIILQFYSPGSAPINGGFIEGGFLQLDVAGGVIRPSGTFTTVGGQAPFVASTICMIIYLYNMPSSERPIKNWLLYFATLATIVMTIFSGSRTILFQAVLILLFSVISFFLISKTKIKFRTLFIPFSLIVSTIVLANTVFSEPFQLFLQRIEAAGISESVTDNSLGTIGRILSSYTSFLNLIPYTPLQGFGLGTFGNAFTVSNYDILALSIGVEDDWARNIGDLGPLMGLLYIFFRVFLVISLLITSIIATKLSNNPLPMLLIGFIGSILLNGLITGNGSINGFGWLYAGFTMAGIRINTYVATKS